MRILIRKKLHTHIYFHLNIEDCLSCSCLQLSSKSFFPWASKNIQENFKWFTSSQNIEKSYLHILNYFLSCLSRCQCFVFWSSITLLTRISLTLCFTLPSNQFPIKNCFQTVLLTVHSYHAITSLVIVIIISVPYKLLFHDTFIM